MVIRWSALRKLLFLVLFWIKTFHGNHIFHILLVKFLNLLVLLVDQVLVSLSLLWKRYYSLVYPYFQYCIIVWGSTYSTNLNRLILLQKCIVRIVNKKPFDAHTDPLFRDLKFLKFVDIYSLHLGKLMYSYNNNLLPPSFSNFF